jgi:hypothetical protein
MATFVPQTTPSAGNHSLSETIEVQLTDIGQPKD